MIDMCNIESCLSSSNLPHILIPICPLSDRVPSKNLVSEALIVMHKKCMQEMHPTCGRSGLGDLNWEDMGWNGYEDYEVT